MTAQGEDVLAWLNGAISEREKTARAAEAISPSPWTAGPNEDESVAHMAANDPESVLRRCAADRKLLASHQPAAGVGYEPDDDDTPGAYGDIASACTSCGTLGEFAVRFPCHVVRLLAQGYGWTEDEQRRCGYTKQHPSHTFMRLEVLFQCPGDEGMECPCASGSPEMYEGPLRDCPIHGERGTEGQR